MWRARSTKSNKYEKNENESLFVFGYACKLFENDAKAEWIAEERHLISSNQDDSIKIDRTIRDRCQFVELGVLVASSTPTPLHPSSIWYDCRLHLHDCDHLDTMNGQDVDEGHLDELEEEEQLCHEERYRDLHQAIQKQQEQEDEIKRVESKGVEIQFSYESVQVDAENVDDEEDDDEPFVPNADLKLPSGMDLPETMKLNAIIEKTAMFVVAQGAQMEIVIKARQRNNNQQFGFLDWDHPLNVYYKCMCKLIREKKYIPRKLEQDRGNKCRKQKAVGMAHSSDSDSDVDSGHYLHPLLSGGAGRCLTAESAANSPKNASQLPSIDYRLGEEDDVYSALYLKLSSFMPTKKLHTRETTAVEQQEQQPDRSSRPPTSSASVCPSEETSSSDDFFDWHHWFYGRDPPPCANLLLPPPPDLAPVVNRTAEFVAKFGPAAEEHLRKRPELHLDFLVPDHPYHASYQRRIRYVQWEQQQVQLLTPTEQQKCREDGSKLCFFPEVPAAVEQKPFTGPVSFSIVSKSFDDSDTGAKPNTDPSLQSQMNESPTPSELHLQLERKEKARAFLERILNEKRVQKRLEEDESRRLLDQVNEAAERAVRLADESVEQTVPNKPQRSSDSDR